MGLDERDHAMRFPDKQKLMTFAAQHCTGREFDSCINSPCEHSSASGCMHPEHPKWSPPLLTIGERVVIHTRQNEGRTGIVQGVDILNGFHWILPDDRNEYAIGPFTTSELETI